MFNTVSNPLTRQPFPYHNLARYLHNLPRAAVSYQRPVRRDDHVNAHSMLCARHGALTWVCKSSTFHERPRLKVAPESMKRFKGKVKEILR